MRIAVTGGSGKLGRATVADLLANGYEVVVLDAMAPRQPLCPYTLLDLTDYGQTVEALSRIDGRYDSVDAVVHLAAIPAPGLRPNAHTFANNTVSTFNVFQAAKQAGIKNLVWASSETVLGLPFDTPPPYVPIDEDYAGRPETSYSLAKLVEEEMARQFCRWDRNLKMIGLRFSNVMEPQEYLAFPDFEKDPASRKWNLWGYIDARDGAQAIRKALEYSGAGMDIFIIANADTVMSRPNSALLAEFYPNVPLRCEVGENETLLSIDKARRVLGYAPQYSWRDQI